MRRISKRNKDKLRRSLKNVFAYGNQRVRIGHGKRYLSSNRERRRKEQYQRNLLKLRRYQDSARYGDSAQRSAHELRVTTNA